MLCDFTFLVQKMRLECNTVSGPSAPSYSYLFAMVANAKETVVKTMGMLSILVEPRLGSGGADRFHGQC